ncbi:MAG: DUF5057 domain-containing protein [Lachnospiraceae bacterium]|nr:DUF5057 domain-containing protein [Lachnospiraceae bacterium]
MPNRKKKIVKFTSICLITALFAGVVLSSQTKVVEAAEAFLDVQNIWNNNTETSPKEFIILEVVDEKSKYSDEEIIDDIGDLDVVFGEEELGYLIGGQEPFKVCSSYYNLLYLESRNLSEVAIDADGNSSIDQGNIAQVGQIKNNFELLITKISSQCSQYFVNDAPLTVVKDATSFHPNPAEYEKFLRFVEKVDSAEGWMVEDENGVYVEVRDTNGMFQGFAYAGESGIRTLTVAARPEKNPLDESTSDNSLSENSTSDNDMSDSSLSDNTTDPTTPGNGGSESNQNGEGTDGDNQTGEGTGSENQSGEGTGGNNQTGEGTGGENQTGEEAGGDNQTGEGTGGNNQTGEGIGGDTPTGNSLNSNETPKVEETGVIGEQSSIKYSVEVGHGKQIELMGEASAPKRYSFYHNDEVSNIPEGVKKYKVSINADASTNNDNSDGGDTEQTTQQQDATEPVENQTYGVNAIYKFSFWGIKNNEWFKEQVFGMTEDTYEQLDIQVITCLPSELNAEMIQAADLLYWNSKENDTVASDANPVGKDISKTNAVALMTRITAGDPLPCIINHNVFTALNTIGQDNTVTTGVNNNINKLLHLLYQKDIEDIYLDESYGFVDQTAWDEEITDANTDTDTTWEKMNASISAIDSGHFVRDNIYVINHSISSVNTGEKLGDEITGDKPGFAEVDYRVEQEKYERMQSDNVSAWPDALKRTPALAIQTILTYEKVPAVIQKSHITVLELQPCYSFTYAGSEEKKNAFKTKFLPQGSTAEVEIIGMTTSEFCGKIEDINAKYDMIYIGSNTDLMNRTQVASGDYCTVYNDFNMYGVVYAHTGDLCHISGHNGTLASNKDANTYRYSGNDILEEQVNDLLEFLQSEAPIVVADDFFVKTDDRITGISTGPLQVEVNDQMETVTVTDNKKTVEGITRNGILDSSSYVYQFVKKATENKDGSETFSWENRKYLNLLTAGEVSSPGDTDDFTKWLNQPKMFIHMLSQPTEYSYTTKKEGNSTVIADSNYLVKEADGYYLTYEFYISSIASEDIQNTRYNASLWIDTNMDGKFSNNSENLSGSHFDIINMDSGSPVERNQLKNGIRYQIRRKLPEEIVGAVPWKLEIRNEENPRIRSAATGITAVRLPEKQKIRILQLCHGGSNIETNMKTEGNHWKALLNNVPDFEVEVKSIDGGQYFAGQIDETLDNYDMLIVGFKDAYLVNAGFQKERLDAILDYADSGKCILFSHDNTNWINTKTNSLNTYVRDLTGLDRYGVSVYRATNIDLFNTNNKIKDGNNITNITSKTAFFESMGMGEYKRDIAYAINQNQTVMDSRTQGLSYSGNEHDIIASTTPSDYITFKGQKYGDYYRYLNFGDLDPKTSYVGNSCHVEKINVGAITEYPYRLSDTINIASTHGQYFQLDLESDSDGDGEGDIVVWYTLNGVKPGAKDDIYDYSPNDVRNNYYIYNRGNITYTGMGHSDISKNEEEIKLFINTMIAAYRVATQPPNLKIIEGETDDTDKSFDAIPMDANVTDNENFYKVHFKAEDVNLVSDEFKDLHCKIYLEGGSNVLSINGADVNVTEKTGQILNGWELYQWIPNQKEGNKVELKQDNGGNYYYKIVAGVEYYFKVPLVEQKGTVNEVVNLSETKSMDIYIEVQSFITKNKKVNESALIYDNIKLTQLNLFDLD